jgi:hypothetical protein
MVEQPTHNLVLAEEVPLLDVHNLTILLANEHVEIVSTKFRILVGGKYLSKTGHKRSRIHWTIHRGQEQLAKLGYVTHFNTHQIAIP